MGRVIDGFEPDMFLSFVDQGQTGIVDLKIKQ